jgi:hypothetical protein
MKLRKNRERFEDRFLELAHPLLRETFVRCVVAPRLQIFTVKKLHRDVGVLAFVIDARAVINRDKPAERLNVHDVLEVRQLEPKAGERPITDFVRLAAFEVKNFDDDSRVLRAEDEGFCSLLE